MQVTFKSDQVLGNRPFKAGKQIVSDHLAGNQKFKQLVKSGHVIVHPRDVAAQKVLNSKNALALTKAELHRKAGKVLDAARASAAKPHEVTEIAAPDTASKIEAKKAALAAAKAGKS